MVMNNSFERSHLGRGIKICYYAIDLSLNTTLLFFSSSFFFTKYSEQHILFYLFITHTHIYI
ncbi:hypothetical protein J3Q64DRAFT_1673769 [Phycomyces blakesleeanus]|uniref:Uncharacterized protein n=1 Tax=Phycomyces blakesleeanus TaxID=4837 RepID=A0ABR3B6J9_PHYBL